LKFWNIVEYFLETPLPVVSVKFDPQITATEHQNTSVHIHCEVATEDEKSIDKYRWFFNGNLTKEIQVCEG
jgi:hypothetical protein